MRNKRYQSLLVIDNLIHGSGRELCWDGESSEGLMKYARELQRHAKVIHKEFKNKKRVEDSEMI